MGLWAWFKRVVLRRPQTRIIFRQESPGLILKTSDCPYLFIDGALQAQQRAIRFTIKPDDPRLHAGSPGGAGLVVNIHAEHVASTCGEYLALYRLMQEQKTAEAHIAMGGSGERIVVTGVVTSIEMVAEVGKTTLLRFDFAGTAYRATRS